MSVCMRGCFYIKPGGTAGVCIISSCPCNVSFVWDESFFVWSDRLESRKKKGEEK